MDIVKSKNDGIPVVFLVGRMNPPTPGHIKLIKHLYEEGVSRNARIRVYLSRSHSSNKWSKPQQSRKITGLSTKKIDSSLTKPWVKNKSYENPLSPKDKKSLILQMLKNIGIVEFAAETWTDEYGDEILITDEVPNCNGIFFARKCAEELQPNLDLHYFVMGAELDDKERANREQFCINKSDDNRRANSAQSRSPVVSADNKIKCIFVERTEDESNPIASVSGSKVRLLAANMKNNDRIKEMYYGYLTDEQVEDMVRKIRKGLNMDMIKKDLASPRNNKRRKQSATRRKRTRTPELSTHTVKRGRGATRTTTIKTVKNPTS